MTNLSDIAFGLAAAKERAEVSSEQLKLVVNGPEHVEVETETGPVPTVKEFLRQAKQQIDDTVQQDVGDLHQAVVQVDEARTETLGYKEQAQELTTQATQVVQDGFNAFGDATDPDKGASLVGWRGRSLADKNAEALSIDDFSGPDDTAKLSAANAVMAAKGGGKIRFPARSYNYTFTQPPPGVVWQFDGPSINRSQIGGTAGPIYKDVTYGVLNGPHNTHQVHLKQFKAVAVGSGGIGSPVADHAVGVTVEKQFWSETQGTPQAGEIDGISIMYRQGGPRSGEALSGISSGAAILADVGATKGCGASQFFEGINSVFDADNGLSLFKQIGIQIGMQNTRDNDYYGMVLSTYVGAQKAAFRVQGTSAAPWTRIIENIKDGRTNFAIDDVGQLRWQASNDLIMRLGLDQATGELVVQNNLNTEVARFTQTGIQVKPQPITRTGTAETLTQSDLGKVIVYAPAAEATLTLPNNLPVGWNCRIIQREPAQIVLSPASGASLRAKNGSTKTAVRYGVVDLYVGSNGNGTSAVWYASGDLA